MAARIIGGVPRSHHHHDIIPGPVISNLVLPGWVAFLDNLVILSEALSEHIGGTAVGGGVREV